MSIRPPTHSREACSGVLPASGASSYDPARVRHPRDKPRVERGVPYVRERFFKGGEFTGLSDMRSAARRWCLDAWPDRGYFGTTPQAAPGRLPG